MRREGGPQRQGETVMNPGSSTMTISNPQLTDLQRRMYLYGSQEVCIQHMTTLPIIPTFLRIGPLLSLSFSHTHTHTHTHTRFLRGAEQGTSSCDLGGRECLSPGILGLPEYFRCAVSILFVLWLSGQERGFRKSSAHLFSLHQAMELRSCLALVQAPA